ncbi:MAG: hypothetical protein RAP03_05590, partial [Candidatus Electryonea clarkiae]|nr:hypothetical protein [Candidatus Electryonea clarkiae]
RLQYISYAWSISLCLQQLNGDSMAQNITRFKCYRVLEYKPYYLKKQITADSVWAAHDHKRKLLWWKIGKKRFVFR